MPVLAHAVSRAGIAELADRSAALYARLYRKTVEECAGILQRHLGEAGAGGGDEDGPALGSRSRASVDRARRRPRRRRTRAAARGRGAQFGPMRQETRVGEYPLRLTAHAVARLLQRTIGSGDVRAIGPLILHHLAQAGGARRRRHAAAWRPGSAPPGRTAR